jgi:hypothetical protein
MPNVTAHELNDEQRRILRAAREGRLRVNEHGRYIILNEKRPSRREREQLLYERHAITWPRRGDNRVSITDEGIRLLEGTG